METRRRQILLVIFTCSLTAIAFQNCSKVGVNDVPASVLSAAGAPTGSVAGPVVCDPFATTTSESCAVSSGAGLLGNVYYLPNGNGVDNYIENGTQLNVQVVLSEINVPTRDWTSGFPGENGSALTEPDGSILNEWFALDLKGFLELPDSMSEGVYQMALMSDDGSILLIDGQQVVNNDGTHAPQWACGGTLNLKHGEKHSIEIKYYQGPRIQIALQLEMRPASQMSQSCDDHGGFQVVPASAFSH
jgi:hypothetical protein